MGLKVPPTASCFLGTSCYSESLHSTAAALGSLGGVSGEGFLFRFGHPVTSSRPPWSGPGMPI